MSRRRTSLAWKNLTHQPARTIVSVGGISFAIVLMFMQLGFLGSVGDTAALVYRRLPGELVIRSSEYLQTYDPRSIDDSAVQQVISLPEVAEALPLDLGVGKWQNPISGEFRAVAMMGIEPSRPAIIIDSIEPLLPLLSRPDHLLVDRSSRFDYGPVDGKRFSELDIGVNTSINEQRVRIAGLFDLGTGLAANGAVLLSRNGFRRLLPANQQDRVSMIVIRLAKGISIEQGRRAIAQRLQHAGGELAYAHVLTIDEAAAAERWHWYVRTPIGLIFWIGVALAVVVGGVICYMVLAADVIAHLPEYATLKAMGYSNRYLGRTLLSQASYLAAISLPPATLLALGLYQVIAWAAGLPIRMTVTWIVLVSLMTFAMCSAAGLLALRKLSKAEPASLF